MSVGFERLGGADSSEKPAGRLGGRGRRGPGGLTPAVPAVYCCCCLANVSLPGIGGTVPESKPFFYVNVADIQSLEVEVSYVACEYGARPILPARPWRGRPGPRFPGRVGLVPCRAVLRGPAA